MKPPAAASPPRPPPGSSRRRRAAPPREQSLSIFTAILERLLASTPGAEGAALVDYEGETVDFYGHVDPFELKVAAAHWQIVLRDLKDLPSMVAPPDSTPPSGASRAEGDGGRGSGVASARSAPHPFRAVRQLTVRARGKSFVAYVISPEYTLVLVVHPRAAFSASDRALQEAHLRLCGEAELPVPDHARWVSVEVEPDEKDAMRPGRLRGRDGWQTLEVMGCMVGLRAREKGYRVRLPNGVEMLLVRERLGRWFADENVSE